MNIGGPGAKPPKSKEEVKREMVAEATRQLARLEELRGRVERKEVTLTGPQLEAMEETTAKLKALL